MTLFSAFSVSARIYFGGQKYFRRHYTVAIVGSGPVGCTFARKLLEANHKVIMLEAGSMISGPPGSHIRNSFRYRRQINSLNNVENLFYNAIDGYLQTLSVPTTDYSIDPAELENGMNGLNRNPEQSSKFNLSGATTVYCVGGMGTIWMCATPRFRGNERFSNLIPDNVMDTLYKDAEKFLNTDLDPYKDTMLQTTVLDKLKESERRSEPLPLAVKYNSSTGDSFWTGAYDILGKDNFNSQNFKLKDNHLAIKLNISQDRARIDTLSVKNLINESESNITADYFIICGGAVLTPQLLYNSGLNSGLPLLGKYLCEQSLAECQVVLKKEIVNSMLNDPRWRNQVNDHKRKYPDDPIPIPFNTPFPAFWIPYDNNYPWHIQVLRGGPQPFFDDRVILNFHCYGRTKRQKDNRVEFSDVNKDLYGMPQPTFHVKAHKSDSDNNRQMVRNMAKIALSIGNFLPGGEPKFLAPGSALHITGTVSMGNNTNDSVVDKNLRVHGLNNLFLGSNGVIPTETAGNPTLTSVALAINSANSIILGPEYTN